jgi:hypothetical protein
VGHTVCLRAESCDGERDVNAGDLASLASDCSHVICSIQIPISVFPPAECSGSGLPARPFRPLTILSVLNGEVQECIRKATKRSPDMHMVLCPPFTRKCLERLTGAVNSKGDCSESRLARRPSAPRDLGQMLWHSLNSRSQARSDGLPLRSDKAPTGDPQKVAGHKR